MFPFDFHLDKVRVLVVSSVLVVSISSKTRATSCFYQDGVFKAEKNKVKSSARSNLVG
jgi:hypothetical protein